MGTLFGTDGIRGKANIYPMTPEIAMKTGRTLALFAREAGYSQIIIGRDTRISGGMLEAALAAGITAMGLDALTAGVIPTPGVAYLTTRHKNAGYGIVISASHNPYQDNGIKIFNHDGYKPDNEEERRIEKYILSEPQTVQADKEIEPGRLIPMGDSLEQYAGFLKSVNPPFEKSLKIVIDASNGAASHVAPMVFTPPVFDAEFIFNMPDGKNINKDCGSQHTETLSQRVLETRADLGLAFDGDADRLIAVDDRGNEVTGDVILAVCAVHAKKMGKLPSNCVVSTVMSNIGLSQALKSHGISHGITNVGDREVLLKMLETGAAMGGEDSGHMIFTDCHTTGDGMVTALKLIQVMLETGQKLSELSRIMTVFPQILMNVEVDAGRPDFTKISAIAKEIEAVEAQLGERGRVLVRYSGTQPLLRVMVEGPDAGTTQTCCTRICNAIRQHMPRS